MNYVQELRARRDALKRQKDELEAKLSPILKEYDALENLLKVVENDSAYPTKGTLKDKVLYSIEQLTKATAKQVIDFMRQHETNVSNTSVTVTCSTLAKKGVIKSTPEGKHNVYSLV
jgi:hypothetical protein